MAWPHNFWNCCWNKAQKLLLILRLSEKRWVQQSMISWFYQLNLNTDLFLTLSLSNPNAFVGSISSFMGWFMLGMVWNSNACIGLLLELNSHFFDPNCSYYVSFHTLWDFARENFRNKPDEIYIMISVVGLWNFSCTHSMILILITQFSSSLIIGIGTTPAWSHIACTTIRISSWERIIIETTLASQNQLW